MKFISAVTVLIFFSTILNSSYLRTIRIGSFPEDIQAKESLIKLEKYFKENENLSNLHKKYKFELKERKSGKYYATLIEPFTNRAVLQKVLDTLRLKYKDAYVTNLKQKSVQKQAIIQEKAISVTPEVTESSTEDTQLAEAIIQQILKIKSKINKKNEAKEEIDTTKEITTQNKAFSVEVPVYY